MDNVFGDKTRGIYLAQDSSQSQAIFPANEDWTAMVEVVEAGAGIVVGKKIWDLSATPRYLFAVQVGTGYPAIGSVVLFHRCGDFANQGANGFELHAGDPAKASWAYLASSPVLEIYDNGNGTGYPVLFTDRTTWIVNGETLPLIGGSVGSGRIFPGQRAGDGYYIFRGSVACTEKTWETDLLIGNANYRFSLDTDAAGKVVDMNVLVTPQVFVDDPTYIVMGMDNTDNDWQELTDNNAASQVFYDSTTDKYYFRAKAANSATNTWHTPTATKWLWQAFSDSAGNQLLYQTESTLLGRQGTAANWVWFEAPRNLTANKARLIGSVDPYVVPPNSSVSGDTVTPTTYIRYIEYSGGNIRRSPLKNCLAYIQWKNYALWSGFYNPATDTAQPWASAPSTPSEAYPCHYWTTTQYLSGNDDATDFVLFAKRTGGGANADIPGCPGATGAFFIEDVQYRANTSVSRHGIYYANRSNKKAWVYWLGPTGWFTMADLSMTFFNFTFYTYGGFYIYDRWKSSRIATTPSSAPSGPSPYFNTYYSLEYV